jgi:hypothetical protein
LLPDAAKKLTGSKRRAFQAQVAIDYLDSRARLTERTFGWARETVALGLHELRLSGKSFCVQKLLPERDLHA